MNKIINKDNNQKKSTQPMNTYLNLLKISYTKNQLYLLNKIKSIIQKREIQSINLIINKT